MKSTTVFILISIIFIGIIIFITSGIKPFYFDENAPVMYFYSDSCHICQVIKPVLEELGNQGYRVSPVDVFVKKDLVQKYGIQGTPTFVGPDGEHFGVAKNQTIEEFRSRLREFLDKYPYKVK